MAFRINFYGGPGVGKSTLAARVYAELNRAGRITVELVQEFVKPWAYERRNIDRFDQIYTFGNQLWREHRLFMAGVDVVVTDSPVLLQCVYTNRCDPGIARPLVDLAHTYEQTYPAINFLVERGRTPYRQEGRYQNTSQLQELDAQIQAMVECHLEHHTIVTAQDWELTIQLAAEAVYEHKDL